MYSAKIIGTGMYVPKIIITNKDIEKFIDTSDEWIKEKIGVKERRICDNGELPSDISAIAAKEAILNSNLNPEDIELIILAITSPDMSVPATSAIVQKKIGAKRAAVFDIRNSCQGFITALITASKFISDGTYNNALIIGTSNTGTILNKIKWRNRSKSVFFGDGSGALILKKCNNKEGILSSDMGNTGEKSDILNFPFGGVDSFINPEKYVDPVTGKAMEGKEIWDFATINIPLSIIKTLTKIDKKPEDLDFIILHQANINIIKSIMNSLNLSMEKTYTNIEKYGNTSEASIPIALHEALKKGKIKNRDLIALSAFGGGLGWASVIIKWGK